MKTKKKVRSQRRQPRVRTEKEALLDEFKVYLNTAFAAPRGPARRELVSIVRRSNRLLGQSIADVVVAKKVSRAVSQCMEDADMEAAAAQIIMGKRYL